MISWDIIRALLVVLIVYISGESFASFFDYTDGEVYSAAYELIKGKYLADAYFSFGLTTGSAEPISFFFFYIFSQFVNISDANTLLNISLLLALFRLLRQNSVNLWCWSPFIFTNFYILILGFQVLRLKIAVLLLVFSWLVQSHRMRWVLLVMSVFSHFQMILPFAVFVVETLVVRRLTTGLKYVAVFAVALILFQYDAIHGKVMFYMSNGLVFPYKLIVLSFLSFLLFDRYKVALIMIMVFLPAALVVGDGRLNIIYFLLIIREYLVYSKRSVYRNVILVLCAAYFSLKGVEFLQSLLGGYNYFEE